MTGGTDPYLCDEDAMAFEGLVVQEAANMNCIMTQQARLGALMLKVIYTQSPSAALLRFASQGHNLIFFRNREELNEGDLPAVLLHIDVVPPIQEDTQPIF
jgi:hypothetical protein